MKRKILFVIEIFIILVLAFVNLSIIWDLIPPLEPFSSKNGNNLTFTKTQLAQGFMDAYEKDEWYLYKPVYFGNYEVSAVRGAIYIDGKITDIRTDSRKLYEEIQSLYFSKDWNGEPITYKDYNIEISQYGTLEISNMNHEREYLSDGLSQHHIDIPLEAMKDIKTDEYVEGEGAYILTIDGKYQKYKQGRLISLPGGKLNYKDPGDYKSVYLVYEKEEGKMYLCTINFMEFCYNYVFPDLNKAKIVELRKGTLNTK